MKISLLQPKIQRGNVEENTNSIQELINKSRGDLLVLPEYALTGSLTLDDGADLDKWIEESDLAKKKLSIPNGKKLLMNSLIRIDKDIYNCCELMPTSEKQIKVCPDDTERKKGIRAGEKHEMFTMFNKKFKIFICMDLKYWTSIDTDDADFILFIYHFTKENYESRILELKEFIKHRKIPVLVSSIVSDRNSGFSTYIDEDTIISISDAEGVLEVEIK